MLYDDGLIACNEDGLVIRRYYPWGGAKHVPYSAVVSVRRRTLSAGRGKWRIWGSGDLVHWWNLDPRRPRKTVALEIDLGGHFVPTITLDDADAVERILSEHAGH